MYHQFNLAKGNPSGVFFVNIIVVTPNNYHKFLDTFIANHKN